MPKSNKKIKLKPILPSLTIRKKATLPTNILNLLRQKTRYNHGNLVINNCKYNKAYYS